ncbi:MAG TPA: DUF4157 domain-containing protein [Verrucomicrobiae bacterium]
MFPLAGAAASPRVGHDFSRIPIHPADGQVMRMPELSLQRACSCGSSGSGGECEECRKKKLQRKTSGLGAGNNSTAPPIVHEVLRSPGHPLDAGTRAFMEPRFGHDFSRVRVHADTRAAESARAVNAFAYTVGQDVVLDSGSLPPSSKERMGVMAHELVHTLQQPRNGSLPETLQIGSESNAAETEAEQLGGAAVRRMARTGTAVRETPPMLRRLTRKGCIAPSFVVDFMTASVFGTIAESVIDADYLAQKGGTPFGDVFFDNPIGPLAYIAFLAAHHPSLNKTLLAVQISLAGGVLVPDILDTRPAAAPEFYDVKPDSPDGRAAGRGKLAAIDAFMSFNSLPYARGSSYSPNPSIPLPLGGPALIAAIAAVTGGAVVLPALACGLPVVTLAPRRAANGLLLYEVCVEADLDCYLKVLTLEALLAAIIIAIIASDGILVPAAAGAAAAGGAFAVGAAGAGTAGQDIGAKPGAAGSQL